MSRAERLFRNTLTHCMNAVAMMTPLPKNLQKSKTSGWAKTDFVRRKSTGARVPTIEVTCERWASGPKSAAITHATNTCVFTLGQENLAYLSCASGFMRIGGYTHEDDKDRCDTQSVPRVVIRGGTRVFLNIRSVLSGGVHSGFKVRKDSERRCVQIWLFEVVFFPGRRGVCVQRFADIAVHCPVYIFLLTDGRCSLTKLSRCHSVLRIEYRRGYRGMPPPRATPIPQATAHSTYDPLSI
jgi:hypothetical protein